MKESVKNRENIEKNPYAYNGEAIVISPPSSSSTENSPEKEAVAGSQHIKLDDTNKKKVYIESYGCQMNFSDTEIVVSILTKSGFTTTSDINKADIILLNTCAIRDKAEQTIYSRLTHIKALKKQNQHIQVGILGCMAERMKKKLQEKEKSIDLAVGPDAYRTLPELIHQVEKGHKAINTFLSREETYADIIPVRSHPDKVTAFISIMRGCDNMCSFCVVPFTRGRERSRDVDSIVAEATSLFQQGCREVTLLGQNVDSYKWSPEENNKARIAKKKITKTINFAELLERVARIHPDLRIRFSTSHPRDITDHVLYTMAKYKNICKQIHLPAQSGNNRILSLMQRGYTREWYLEKIGRIRSILGREVGISSDMIAGFCGETNAEHQDTLDLMDAVQFDFAYMFCYSDRPNTIAAKKLQDDVPSSVKKARLQEIIHKQNQTSLERNQQSIGKRVSILVEGPSKRSSSQWQGRTSTNKVAIFPHQNEHKGDYIDVLIKSCTSATLLGKIVDRP